MAGDRKGFFCSVSWPVMKGIVRWVAGNTAGVTGEKDECYCRIKGKHLLSRSCNLVAGDHVEYTPTHYDKGVILFRKERERVLHHWDEMQRKPQLIAANICDVYCVVAGNLPPYDLEFLTAVLVASDIQGLTGHIICTKIDQKVPELLKNHLEYLHSLGYSRHYVSNTTGEGIDELRSAITQRSSVLCGQSGVGKSTLMNLLHPLADQRTAITSPKGGRGRHTTNCAMLFPFPQGFLIDTPGVRNFLLYGHSLIDIRESFSDFVEYAVGCRFHGCTHLHEPNCAVMAAHKEGEFPPGRYAVYRKIVESWQSIDAFLRSKGLASHT